MTSEIFLIDIGNTRVKTAVFSENKIKAITSVLTKDFDKKLAATSLKDHAFKKRPVYFISVVPSATEILTEVLKEQKCQFAELNYLKLPINIKENFPSDIGADLLALVFSVPIAERTLIADIGTFNKYLLIYKNQIECAAISPGYNLKYSLISKGALLSQQTPKIPETLLAKNTRDCLDSGIYFSSCFEISEFLRIICKDNPTIKSVYLTGGSAQFFLEKLKGNLPLKYDDTLVFKGMIKLANLILGGKKWLIKN